MKITHKLLILMLFSVFITVVPLEMVILHFQRKSITETRNIELSTNAKILAQSMVTILLLNGGELKPSMVDARDMIQILEPLKKQGLIYGDVLLKIQGENYNTRLASIERDHLAQATIDAVFMNRIDDCEPGVVMLPDLAGYDSNIIQIAIPGLLRQGDQLCVVRLFFNEKEYFAPLTRIQEIMVFSTALFFIFTIIVVIIMSRLFTRPVLALTKTAQKISEGALDTKVAINSTDEIGQLARSFNSMTEALRTKINELEETNIDLERLNRLKDDFLATTTHELKTPLNGIIGIIDSLLTAPQDQTDVEANLRLVLSSGHRLLRLVNDILDMAKLKHSDMQLDLHQVDVLASLRVVYDLLLPHAQKKGLNITIHRENDIPPIFADEHRIQQIFINLIENSLKFTEEGGVSITAALKNNRQVEIDIADTGIGIEKEKIDTIFDDFIQADSSINRRFGGTGLGLSITRRLVELHGGTITCRSEINKGTTFTIMLPLAIEEEIMRRDLKLQENRSPAYRSELTADTNYTRSVHETDESEIIIHIVDDEPVNVQVLVNLLSSQGYGLRISANGTEALESLEKGPLPHIMLLDIMMPGLSGFDVCREIRKKHSLNELPVLMLTALKRTEDITAGFRAGANDYISKPFERQELLARINTLLKIKESLRNSLELEVFHHELEIAHQIQRAILPKEIPQIEGAALAVAFRPMHLVAGDLYDFHTFQDKRIGLFLADVTGHGTPAAIISAMVKVVFSGATAEAQYPEYLLQRCNVMLSKYSTNHFLTALYALVDLENMKVSVARGGHWPLYILRRESDELLRIKPAGMILGLTNQTKFEKIEEPLKKGDRIIMVTDGILEQQNPSGELFTEDRFLSMVKSQSKKSAQEFVNLVFSEVEKFSGIDKDGNFDDDASLLVLDILD